MKVYEIDGNVIPKEKLDEFGIKTISIISETDILHPRCIVKYKDGIKKYFHMDMILDTDEKFKEFLYKHIPELKD